MMKDGVSVWGLVLNFEEPNEQGIYTDENNIILVIFRYKVIQYS